MRRFGNRLIPQLSLLVALLILAACGKPREITPEQADYWEPVTFDEQDLWSQKEREAVLSGFNSSEGAFHWNVWFYEGNKGIDIRFFPRSIASHIVNGKIFQGFSHLNTVGVSDLYDNSPRSIESLARHEIQHWLGRVHKSDFDIRRMKKKGSGLVPDSMTWMPWPEKTKYPLKKKPQPDK